LAEHDQQDARQEEPPTLPDLFALELGLILLDELANLVAEVERDGQDVSRSASPC
jgi:hypothetical protein